MEMHDGLSLHTQYGSPPPPGPLPVAAPQRLHCNLSAPPIHAYPGWDFEQQLPGALPTSFGAPPPEQQHEQALLARLREQQLKLQQQRAEQEAWAAAARAVLVRNSGGRPQEHQVAQSSSSIARDPMPQQSTGSSSRQPYLACNSLPATPTHSPLPLAAAAPTLAGHANLATEAQPGLARQTQQAQQAAKLAALQQVIGQLQAEIVDLEAVEQQQQAEQQQQVHLAAELAKQRQWELKRRQWEEEQARQAAFMQARVAGSPAVAAPPAPALGTSPGRQQHARERHAAAVGMPLAPAGQPPPWSEFQPPDPQALGAAHPPMLQQQQLAEGEGEQQLLHDQRARLQQAWLRLQAGQRSPSQEMPAAASPTSPGAASTPFGSCPARLSGPWPQAPAFMPQDGQLSRQEAAGQAQLGAAQSLRAEPSEGAPLPHQPGRAMSLDLQAAPSFEMQMPELLELGRPLSPGVGMPATAGQPPTAGLPSEPGSASVGYRTGGGSGGLEFQPSPVAPMSAAAQQGWWGSFAGQGEAQA